MSKKWLPLISVLMLCSCNQGNQTEPITTESTEKIVEPSISMTVKELEKDQSVMLRLISPLISVDRLTNLNFSFDDDFSMWDRLTENLSKKGFNTTYLNDKKDEILAKQNKEVRDGLSYVHNTNGFVTNVILKIDGESLPYGYYCGFYECFEASKYEITYQEDDKKETFCMYVPQTSYSVIAATKHYENPDDFYKEVTDCCLKL